MIRNSWWVLVVLALIAQAAKAEDEKPLFRFLQVNDLHVQHETPPPSPIKQTYKGANARACWIVESLGNATLPKCDFVVGVGDLVHGTECTNLDLETFQTIIKPLSIPFHPVVGNHEVNQRERSEEYLKPYWDAFGKDRSDYVFQHGGILFISLNDSGAPNATSSKQRNEWLAGVLEANEAMPKILLCHIPLVSVRDEDALAKSFGFSSYRDQDPGTLELVEKYSESMIAVLSGHLHLTGMKQRKGIYHISISGTASYPCDIAFYEVFPDHIHVSVRQLPSELRQGANTIHGIPRYKTDFTDSDHPTAQEYQCGTKAEREFDIPLPESKRPAVQK